MDYTVYQLPLDNEFCFRFYAFIKSHNDDSMPISDYELVYSGHIDIDDEFGEAACESIFMELNTHHPSDYKSRSLSISDILRIKDFDGNDEYWFCDRFGWIKLDFWEDM